MGGMIPEHHEFLYARENWIRHHSFFLELTEEPHQRLAIIEGNFTGERAEAAFDLDAQSD